MVNSYAWRLNGSTPGLDFNGSTLRVSAAMMQTRFGSIVKLRGGMPATVWFASDTMDHVALPIGGGKSDSMDHAFLKECRGLYGTSFAPLARRGLKEESNETEEYRTIRRSPEITPSR